MGYLRKYDLDNEPTAQHITYRIHNIYIFYGYFLRVPTQMCRRSSNLHNCYMRYWEINLRPRVIYTKPHSEYIKHDQNLYITGVNIPQQYGV